MLHLCHVPDEGRAYLQGLLMLGAQNLTAPIAEAAVAEASALSVEETFIPTHQPTVVITQTQSVKSMALGHAESRLARHHHLLYIHH